MKYFLILVSAFLFSGCFIFKKNTSSSSSTLDSTSVSKATYDSSVQKDSSHAVKEQGTTTLKGDSSNATEQTQIEEETHTKEFDTSGKVTKETTTTKKTTTHKDQKGGSYTFIDEHSKLDTTGAKTATAVAKKGNDSTHTAKTDKQTQKTVERTVPFYLTWWFWLIIIVVLIVAAIRFRKQIVDRFPILSKFYPF